MSVQAFSYSLPHEGSFEDTPTAADYSNKNGVAHKNVDGQYVLFTVGKIAGNPTLLEFRKR
jgi:hypothetical protein